VCGQFLKESSPEDSRIGCGDADDLFVEFWLWASSGRSLGRYLPGCLARIDTA